MALDNALKYTLYSGRRALHNRVLPISVTFLETLYLAWTRPYLTPASFNKTGWGSPKSRLTMRKSSFMCSVRMAKKKNGGDEFPLLVLLIMLVVAILLWLWKAVFADVVKVRRPCLLFLLGVSFVFHPGMRSRIVLVLQYACSEQSWTLLAIVARAKLVQLSVPSSLGPYG